MLLQEDGQEHIDSEAEGLAQQAMMSSGYHALECECAANEFDRLWNIFEKERQCRATGNSASEMNGAAALASCLTPLPACPSLRRICYLWDTSSFLREMLTRKPPDTVHNRLQAKRRQREQVWGE